jgi:hypothetical protein
MVFIGAFGVQWGLGLLIDLLQGYGQSAATAHRSAFLVLLRRAVRVADLVLDRRPPATLIAASADRHVSGRAASR